MNTAEHKDARTAYAVSLARRRAALNAIARDMLLASDRQIAMLQHFSWAMTHPEKCAARRRPQKP